MPRRPRWDAPGAVHHVWFRGIERRPIFLDDGDRHDFVDRLCKVVPECGAALPGWALLENHGHAIVRSGDVPLSRLMQRICTGHAVRFNKRRERAGHLFQGRFGSRLVADDRDLQGLLRYVHLNPLRSGLVRSLRELERYPWCGYGSLLGRRAPRPFESVAYGLALFAGDVDLARRRLRAWMAQEPLETAVGVEPPAPAPARTEAVVVPEAPTPDLDRLVDAVSRWFSVTPAAVRRGARTERATRARAVICHVAVERWRLANRDVARAVGVTSAAVSHALSRGARLAREECDLRRLPLGEILQ